MIQSEMPVVGGVFISCARWNHVVMILEQIDIIIVCGYDFFGFTNVL